MDRTKSARLTHGSAVFSVRPLMLLAEHLARGELLDRLLHPALHATSKLPRYPTGGLRSLSNSRRVLLELSGTSLPAVS